ncbi:MAG: Rpn family recombination-promoting nuclease/putative transposase [Candidatus Riflebacteria bacterium]|nr:Rpn family recombination-promoting nuclease/putative transposase [Candidatus Riflebacteria bacterium]
MEDHDESYKKFFSFPEMVEDLLRGFVHEEWIERLDFLTLERVNGSYVTDTFRQRHDDVVWRVRWGEEWLYVYILIEFQSEVDEFMALRIMTYIGLLYQDLIGQKQLFKGKLLPPVLPIVLYNGVSRWTAAEDVYDLIVPLKGGLEKYRPHISYLLIDEGRYAATELSELHNLVAALFRLEKSRDMSSVRLAIENLIEWLKLPDQKELRSTFTRWIYKVFIQTRFPKEKIPEIQDLEEARTMLSKTVVEWTKQWKEEGRVEGIEEGLEEGLEKGLEKGRKFMATLVLRQIERKFGTLNESDRQRISEAKESTLIEWGERLITASGLDEIFKH